MGECDTGVEGLYVYSTTRFLQRQACPPRPKPRRRESNTRIPWRLHILVSAMMVVTTPRPPRTTGSLWRLRADGRRTDVRARTNRETFLHSNHGRSLPREVRCLFIFSGFRQTRLFLGRQVTSRSREYQKTSQWPLSTDGAGRADENKRSVAGSFVTHACHNSYSASAIRFAGSSG